MGTFFFWCFVIFILSLAIRVLWDIAESLRNGHVKRSRRSIQALWTRECATHANRILNHKETMAIEDVVERAGYTHSQYRLMQDCPEAWASAYKGGYLETLAQEMKKPLWMEPSLHTSSSPSIGDYDSLEDFRNKARHFYLEHLHLYWQNVIDKRLRWQAEVDAEVRGRIEEEELRKEEIVKRIKQAGSD